MLPKGTMDRRWLLASLMQLGSESSHLFVPSNQIFSPDIVDVPLLFGDGDNLQTSIVLIVDFVDG